jgi:hypothetical protein
MFMEMEKFEEFLAMIKSEDNKEIPIFLREVKAVNQNGILSGAVVMQYQYDTDMVVVYREVLPPVALPQVANLKDEKSMGGVNEYATKISKDFIANLEAEKQKAIKILDDMGFKNIIPSVWG